MKKIQFQHRPVAYVQCDENKNLSVCCDNKRTFDSLLERLWMFAKAADSGLEKVTREFIYSSDADNLIVTFQKNVTQAVIVLHADGFIDDAEKAEILKSIKAINERQDKSNLLKWLSSKFTKKSAENHESTSLLKKE